MDIHAIQTIQLEQEGKRHLEETLRLNLEEKDDLITVLQTQVCEFNVYSPETIYVNRKLTEKKGVSEEVILPIGFHEVDPPLKL